MRERVASGIVWLLGVLGVAATPAAASLTYHSDPAAFAAAAAPEVFEDFEDGAVTAGNTTVCSATPLTAAGDGSCFAAGELPANLNVAAYGLAGGPFPVAISGPGVHGNASIVAGAQDAADTWTVVGFAPVGAVAVGLVVHSSAAPEVVSAQLMDASFGVIDVHPVAVTPGGTFFGVVSTTDQPIAYVVLASAGNERELVDDIRYTLIDFADLDVDLSHSQPAAGIVELEILAKNLSGPDAAPGVVVRSHIPDGLAYLSNDCGGINGNPFTWNVGTLAAGATATCTIQTSVVTAGGKVHHASITGGIADSQPSNDQAMDFLEVAPSGTNTVEPGLALFRSFPPLVAKDQNGASYDFRAHAGKVIVVQTCGRWCGPCVEWAEKAHDLHAALSASIGAQNFEIVELLVDGLTQGVPATQADAAAWHDELNYPGPVLHAEGSYGSALYQLYLRAAGEYDAAHQSIGIPYFFILAPDCDNQIAVRGNAGVSLGEEVSVVTSDVTHVTQLATDVWNEHRCMTPKVHRLDRCAVGGAPIHDRPGSGMVEVSESFVVPAGGMTIREVNAVVAYGEDDLHFTASFHGNASGLPSIADACTPAVDVASTRIHGSDVRRISLPQPCKLNAGSTYWLTLTTYTVDNPPSQLPMWLGGLAPDDGKQFKIFDNTQEICPSGGFSDGSCLGEGDTQLCYMLDSVDRLFMNGFESGETGHWSGQSPPTP